MRTSDLVKQTLNCGAKCCFKALTFDQIQERISILTSRICTRADLDPRWLKRHDDLTFVRQPLTTTPYMGRGIAFGTDGVI